MDAEVKKMWVKALRSGEYKQTRGQMKRGDRYCCLGVLRELAPEHMRKEKGESWGVLSRSVRDWAGLPTCNPDITGYAVLVELNDEGRSFREIADLIDRHL